MRLKVILEPSEDGGYTVFVPAPPGCVSEGETLDEAQFTAVGCFIRTHSFTTQIEARRSTNYAVKPVAVPQTLRASLREAADQTGQS